jgi:glycosyltransferase involved in cell wall biosynthesis
LSERRFDWSCWNGLEEVRVLVLASGDLWAGAEVMIYQLVLGLKEFENVEILVVLLNHGRLAEEIKSAGIEVRIVDEASLSILGLTRGILKIVKEFSPHIIHSHRYKENLLAWLVTRVVRKVRLVATQHGMPETAGKKHMCKDSLKNLLSFYLLSFGFQRTVAVSKEMRSLLGIYGFSEKKLEVIHNGILLSSKVVKRKSKSLRIGSAGRLFPVKGYDFFVEVAAKVVTMNEEVQFLLAGDGPEHQMLENAINRYGLQDRFTLLGFVDDMKGFYQSLDMYVNTSLHEGIPMTVLEAMGHGLPVVVPYVGGFSEIVVDGECGYLIAERDIDLFAQKILDLVDLKQREKMGKSARKRVEQLFSRKAMAEKYYQLYTKLLIGE